MIYLFEMIYFMNLSDPWVMLGEQRRCASLAIFVLWSCELWFCFTHCCCSANGLNVVFLCTGGENHRWQIISSTW